MSIRLLLEHADQFDEEQKELLKAADDEHKRLRALVDDLLDLSKIEAGQMTMDFETITLDRVFQQTKNVMLPQAQEKKIELTIDAGDKVLPVKADPTKITWVLINLIGNAIRYSKPGEKIKVFVTNHSDAVYVSVADNGAGIPIEYQSKIFDKFVQVKGDSESGGTGLGLAICKEIVKAHGGTIWVESEPGKGSIFTFTLPYANISKEK
jgi:NtrC-family two-component system sensor histidine kinase KinB